MDSLPLILNRWVLPAILHNFIGTYGLAFEIKASLCHVRKQMSPK